MGNPKSFESHHKKQISNRNKFNFLKNISVRSHKKIEQVTNGVSTTSTYFEFSLVFEVKLCEVIKGIMRREHIYGSNIKLNIDT